MISCKTGALFSHEQNNSNLLEFMPWTNTILLTSDWTSFPFILHVIFYFLFRFFFIKMIFYHFCYKSCCWFFATIWFTGRCWWIKVPYFIYFLLVSFWKLFVLIDYLVLELINIYVFVVLWFKIVCFNWLLLLINRLHALA